LKIAIGFKLQEGPYGGGNSVIKSMRDAFVAAGHTVTWGLEDPDIDIIVLADPRSRSPNISFAAGAILRYLVFTNPNAIVVQQMHDCDERKNTKWMNRRQRIANYAADHAICVGSWMLKLDLVRAENRHAYTALLNGADTSTFNRGDHQPWSKTGPIRLITHHWGANWMKGFDVYSHIDQLLDDPAWRDRLSMTYIGNLPAGFAFRNVRHLEPIAGPPLADELRQHDAYITASINEPAGLHHMEGALCGLPILYRDSGALPEYCAGFGISFTGVEDFLPALDKFREQYDVLYRALDEYPYTDQRMTAEYLALFEQLLERRQTIVARRRIFRNPVLFVLNQIPF